MCVLPLWDINLNAFWNSGTSSGLQSHIISASWYLETQYVDVTVAFHMKGKLSRRRKFSSTNLILHYTVVSVSNQSECLVIQDCRWDLLHADIAIAWEAQAVFDVAVFALTLYKSYQHQRDLKCSLGSKEAGSDKIGLVELFIRDGTLYCLGHPWYLLAYCEYRSSVLRVTLATPILYRFLMLIVLNYTGWWHS